MPNIKQTVAWRSPVGGGVHLLTENEGRAEEWRRSGALVEELGLNGRINLPAVQSHSFSVLLPSGSLMQMAAAEEDAMWEMIALAVESDPQVVKERMTRAGAKVVPVTIIYEG